MRRTIGTWHFIWWLPLATAAVVSALTLALFWLQQRRQLSGAKAYRMRFLQLVNQLDLVTKGVNQLVPSLKTVKEVKLLDYYEGTLRILETLLGAMRKIPPFGTDPSSLDSAVFLVRDCRQRVGRMQKVFHDAARGQSVRIEDLYGNDAPAQDGGLKVTGCYFCSRPVIAERFAEVKVRIDGAIKDVISCKVCKDELAATKKVKVLHFMQEGKPVHWAEVSDYHPSEDFWNINKRNHVAKSRHLELVQSEGVSPEPPL